MRAGRCVAMKKRLALLGLSLLVILLIAGGYVYWSLNQVPDFYQEMMAAEIDPTTRQAEAKKFDQRTSQLISDIKQAKDWTHDFSEQQVNSWFIEELDGKYRDLLPPEARDPRIKIVENTVLIGFQYKHPNWEGVVSLRVKPWVPKPNQLALEISDVKAGTLPIPLDSVLKQVGDQFKSRGWRVEWRQSDGNDVLIVDFNGSEKKHSVLKDVKVADGKVRVSGSKPPKTK